jgi:glycosyltransferase involved in cell wall biosynthesis
MTILNVTGMLEDATPSLGPNEDDGTYSHIGAKGGTEMMLEGLQQRVPAELLEQFNIICSRVRNVSTDKKNLLWLHDTWDDPESEYISKKENRAKFDKLIFVSNYQQSTFNMGREVPYSDGIVLQNAIEPIPEKVKTKEITRLIYHTTPHRGLELLLPVFEQISANIPNLHLDVYSSFKIYGWEKRDQQYATVFDRCRKHPNITYHGYQSNEVVRRALQDAHIYAYPNIWPETSCISVMEAMSAGCSVVCPNFAALPETTANFATMYPFHEDYNTHANIFANVLLMAIRTHWDETNQNKLKFQKMYTDNFYNWELRAAQWKAFLQSRLKKK